MTSGNATPQAMLQSLNFALNIWMEQKGGKPPARLEDMVSAKIIDRIPPAPPGRRWEINKQKNEVVLVP